MAAQIIESGPAKQRPGGGAAAPPYRDFRHARGCACFGFIPAGVIQGHIILTAVSGSFSLVMILGFQGR
jgi:hypothetical protein